MPHPSQSAGVLPAVVGATADAQRFPGLVSRSAVSLVLVALEGVPPLGHAVARCPGFLYLAPVLGQHLVADEGSQGRRQFGIDERRHELVQRLALVPVTGVALLSVEHHLLSRCGLLGASNGVSDCVTYFSRAEPWRPGLRPPGQLSLKRVSVGEPAQGDRRQEQELGVEQAVVSPAAN